jgi:uncharacterized protein YbcV (DUF1398 family)
MQECTTGSDNGSLTFPQVVMKLMAVGIADYHCDLRRSEKTYYMPSGDSHVVASDRVAGDIAQAFTAQGVESAVRAIQAGRLTYKDFCARIAAAGCVGYFVYITGKRAIYFGRTGDNYVETFPAAQ